MGATRVNRSAFSSVIAIAPFRMLWAAQVCSQLAFAMLLFVLAIRVYQLTGSNAAVSGLFLTFGIPAVLLGLAAGAIVDHVDKRLVLIAADLARAPVALVFFFFPGTLPLLYAASFVTAVITQFYVPSEAPTIPRLVPPRLLLTANGLFSLTYYTSLALGATVAGPAIRFVGPRAVFLLVSALFSLAAWCASRVPPEAGSHARLPRPSLRALVHVGRAVGRSVREGLAYVTAVPTLSEALLLLAGTQVVLALLGTLGPGFADRVLEIDIRDASLLVTGPAILGIMVGAVWVGNRSSPRDARRLIQRGIMAAGVLLILISLTVRLKRTSVFSWFYADPIIIPTEFLLFFLLGVSNSMLDVPANSMLQSAAGGSMRGRVYGLLTAAVGGIGILPIVATGLIADRLGVGKVIFALGAMITLYGIGRLRYNTP